MLIFILALIIGCLAGFLGALLGISGGIIIIPACQLFLGFSPLIAVGTSLLATVFTTLSGAYGYYRAGNIRVNSALVIAAGGLTGVLIGSYLFKAYLSDNIALLGTLLGSLFLFMALRMGGELYGEWRHGAKAVSEPSKPIQNEKVKLFLLGLITGTMAGVLGVGGGFIIVPVLLWHFAAKPSEAAGTALLAMFPYMTIGALIKLQQEFVNLPAGLLLALGCIIGAHFGVIISPRVNPQLFKLIFTLIFLYLSWQYLLT
ncbi:MAG: sulfite exporter TauE/SafE family protein [Syntrophomonadaceae bacterium]|jgi:uncharacterized membrane protein YfcA